MPFDAAVVNVMIASPGDVAAERQLMKDVIHGWNAVHAAERQTVLLPSSWDSHASPLMGGRPQAIINRQVVAHADLLVAVFWTRLGSPTGEAPSGTVEEIEEHLSRGKPAMIYFSNAPVHPESIDEAQYQKLRSFRKECEERGLVETYSSLEEFREKFSRQLTQTVLREFSAGASVTEEAIGLFAKGNDVTDLSAEERELLIEASQDPHGQVMCVGVMGGTIIQTNGKQLSEMGNPRSEARWKAAIQRLLDLGLLEARGYKGELFALTNAGYEAADGLRLEP